MNKSKKPARRVVGGKTSRAVISALTIFSFMFSINMAGATTSTDTSSNQGVVNSISLSGSGSSVNWTVNGYSYKGFKISWSKNSGPTYPLRSGDKYQYFSDPNKTSTTLTDFSGPGTYYVRVCEYLGGSCGKYSNEIKLTLGSGDSADSTSAAVSSISLSGSAGNINWKTTGYSKSGYKVVWSKSPMPTYPNRSTDKYHYYSDANKTSDSLDAFNGSGYYYARVCEYLGGKCGVYSNEVRMEIASNVICTMDYSPVCGTNGKTYSNKCMLSASGATKAYYGECKKDDQIVAIEAKAGLLSDNKLDTILAELNQLRSLVKEQQTQITYLKSLMSDMVNVTTQMQNSINTFVTYGVDDNTKRLGAGERAAVMHSFKAAYGRLPENEADLADAVKIANGRWPSMTSEEAENKAVEKFREIYKRYPDIANNPKDDAAIKIMAYGLKQRAENRNLNSERNGINIFKGVFGKTPSSTGEWNAMQAITYSGATR